MVEYKIVPNRHVFDFNFIFFHGEYHSINTCALHKMKYFVKQKQMGTCPLTGIASPRRGRYFYYSYVGGGDWKVLVSRW